MTHISAGLSTDVLKRAAETSNASLFLSLVCAGRSVDLCYETESDRNAWKTLLDTLCNKEHGTLTGIEGITPSATALGRTSNGTSNYISHGFGTVSNGSSRSQNSAHSSPHTGLSRSASFLASNNVTTNPPTPLLSRTNSFIHSPTDCRECAVEWSVLYSTIGPEIVPFHVIDTILNLDVNCNDEEKYEMNSDSSSFKNAKNTKKENKSSTVNKT